MAAHKYWRVKQFLSGSGQYGVRAETEGFILYTSHTDTSVNAMITAGVTATVTGSNSADNALGDNVLRHISSAPKTFNGSDTVVTFTLATPADIKAVGISFLPGGSFSPVHALIGFTLEYSDNNVVWTTVGELTVEQQRYVNLYTGTPMPLHLPRDVTVEVSGGVDGDVYFGVFYARDARPGTASNSIAEWSSTAGPGGVANVTVQALGQPGFWTFIAQHSSSSTMNAQAIDWIYA